MNWFRFWADTFRLFKYDKYAPHNRALCYLILPAHEDWWWQYRRDHNPANDNDIG